MRAALFLAVLATAATGCRLDLDSREAETFCKIREDIPVCAEAASHSDFQWIEDNILKTNCGGKSCHFDDKGGKPEGKVVFAPGMSYAALLGPDGMGADSDLAPGRKLVEPGSPKGSYLYFLLHG